MRMLLKLLFLISTVALPKVTDAADQVRVATYNIKELSWEKVSQIDERGQGIHPQLKAAAEVMQRVRPDVVLINETDYTGPVDIEGPVPADRDLPRAFLENYLAISQNGEPPLAFNYKFYRPTNTGVPSGVDLNGNGRQDEPNDAYGYGKYPGEYGMLLLSRFPLRDSEARTFRRLLWKNVPNSLLPDGTDGKPAFYSPEAVNIFRLSSKSHWDVAVDIHGRQIHLLCSHPTPPVFDGPEDANGRRNFDEIRFWKDYLTTEPAADWIRDDKDVRGGLPDDVSFIILGDLNSDPCRSDPVNGECAIEQVLSHPRVFDPKPESIGAKAAPDRNSDAEQRAVRTAKFGRLDYVLPSRDLSVAGTGVYWPDKSEEGSSAAAEASDHRLVWIDITLP
ncbi:MAG: endonuclease/exonuclease/phosphatase family protein [Planctomycetaceae bacterium]